MDSKHVPCICQCIKHVAEGEGGGCWRTGLMRSFVGEEGWGRGGELEGGWGWRFAQKCVDFILIESVLGCQVISPGGVKHNSFYLLLLWLTSCCDLDIKDTDNKGKFPKTSGRSTDSAGVKNLWDEQDKTGQNRVRLTQPDVRVSVIVSIQTGGDETDAVVVATVKEKRCWNLLKMCVNEGEKRDFLQRRILCVFTSDPSPRALIS